MVGDIKKLRTAAGLNKQFEWSETDATIDPWLHQFFVYLHRQQALQSGKGSTTTVGKIAKLLFYVQTKAGMQTKKSDVRATLHVALMREYYAKLSGDLDGSGQGFGLQPAAMKNEYAAFEHFRKFLQNDCDFASKDSVFYSHVRDVLHSLYAQLKTVWSKEECYVDQQRLVKEQATPPQDYMAFLTAFTTNPQIKDALAQIHTTYGTPEADPSLTPTINEYRFFTRFLIQALCLQNFQRPGVAQGLSLSDFKNAKAHDGENYLLSVSDNKNRAHSLATVVISKQLYRSFTLYYKRFRQKDMPGTENSDKFFRRFNTRKTFTNISKEIHAFQVKFGLPKLTCTDNRHAVESSAVTIGTPALLRALEQTLNHSESTAKRYYRAHTSVQQAYKNRETVHSLLHALHNTDSSLSQDTSGPSTSSASSRLPPSHAIHHRRRRR